MPLGSSTWSVVTQNAGPLYASLEERTKALVELREFFLEEGLVLVFIAADFGMQSIISEKAWLLARQRRSRPLDKGL
jgi:hypothetical protein